MITAVTYTTPKYRPVAERGVPIAGDGLIPSLQRVGMRYIHVQTKAEFRTWFEAARHKSAVLRDAWEKEDGDILWLDADAVVRSDPRPHYESLNCDVAFHQFGDEYLASTNLFKRRPNDSVINLLRDWDELNRITKNRCDQGNFKTCVDRSECVVARLPVEYAFIFDTHKRLNPGVTPVIEQFQASRIYRTSVRET